MPPKRSLINLQPSDPNYIIAGTNVQRHRPSSLGILGIEKATAAIRVKWPPAAGLALLQGVGSSFRASPLALPPIYYRVHHQTDHHPHRWKSLHPPPQPPTRTLFRPPSWNGTITFQRRYITRHITRLRLLSSRACHAISHLSPPSP
jgi:hypothetical protein